MTTITSTGTEPVAVETPEKPPPGISARILTAVIVLTPLVALGWAADRFWHRGIGWLDFLLAAAFYLITGFGITLGFHRLFTHRSFRARRGLRICLAIAGSMAVEGSVISWVSHHRRHHVYADGPGDPHSPQADTACSANCAASCTATSAGSSVARRRTPIAGVGICKPIPTW
jgi:stearoyl-CoA desaturase (delta-9 desaturase)